MTALPSQLKSLFWSLYGWFVWDEQKTPSSQIQRITTILATNQVGSGAHVLDAGCGTGNYSLALAQAGFRVTGIDYAAGMLARARAKATSTLAPTLSFQQMSLDKPLVFPDSSFDHIINISVLQSVANPAFTLGELWRVLKPGGLLVLLHVPKPKSHEMPLRHEIRRRIDHLETKTLWKMALVTAKCWAERTGGTRYWTATELREMLQANRYHVLSVDDGPPLIVVAEKPKGWRPGEKTA